jgi:murE/murF fusion protein
VNRPLAALSATHEQILGWLHACVSPAAHLSQDSRAIQPGDVFLACAGQRSDGRLHIGQAIDQGAVAVVYEAEAGSEIDAAAVHALLAGKQVPGLPVGGLKAALGALASAWYGHPSRDMAVIAVTGTNGKTSCTQWLSTALSAGGIRCGVIGTLGTRMAGSAHLATGLTTPDAVLLHRTLADMRAQGADAVAIEASSIGIVEGRLDGLKLRAAAFTNLSRDHLDYHGDMAAYGAAKRRLFAWPGIDSVVINQDDPVGENILLGLAQTDPDVAAVGFSLRDASADALPARHATLRALDLNASSQGMVFTLVSPEGSAQVATHLLGEHNVANLLLVAGVLRAFGWSLQRVASALSAAQAAPGRLEPVSTDTTLPMVVVDYAHTPDALQRALEALAPLARARQGRRVCVFGCGGDRDPGKRPIMARIAQDNADRLVITSDNPRSESPQRIIEEILGGLSAATPAVTVEADRALAIRTAILSAAPGDVILIAGKGHETYQEIAGERHPFSDVSEARRVLADYPRPAPHKEVMSSIAEAARIMGGVLHQAEGADANRGFSAVNTDTRSIRPGDLFFALHGEQFDGHDYVAAAARTGAAAAVVERPVAEATDLPQIVVKDTRRALGRLGAWHRAHFAVPLIAVTGSNGKTTTKEMIAAILAAWHGEPGRLATAGNLNNDIGVPLTLLRLSAAHRSGVIELGMNHPGEIDGLAAMTVAQVALVTNAQREHQEFMHSVEAVARENGAVISRLAVDGVAVYPADDEYSAVWDELAETRRRLRFGLDASAEVYPTGLVRDAFAARFVLNSPVGTVAIDLPAAGLHNVRNALAAAACAIAIEVPLSVIAAGLAHFVPVKGRMQRQTLPGGELLIDDTYNANPDSVRAAIDVLAGLPAPRALVLGDMAEVGDQGPAMHREVGDYARQHGIEGLFAFGPATADSVQAFGPAGRHADSIDAVVDALRVARPASILVKGSRSMRMERVIAALRVATDPSSPVIGGPNAA